MADNEIRTIRITPSEDEQLEAIAPDYLKGGRKIEQRVRWAIEQFLTMRTIGVLSGEVRIPGVVKCLKDANTPAAQD